jgi:Ca-activated chloride channel family protein
MDALEKSLVTVPAHWFVHPWAFWLLAGLPSLATLAWLAVRRARKRRARLGNPSAVQALITRRGGLLALRALCVFAGLFVLCLGIAGPQWGRDYEQAVASGRDLVVVLDCSRSMLARDVLPSRIDRAKKALRELSFAIQRRGGHRLALVVFAARARIVCPLTHDYDHFRLALTQHTVANLPADLRPRPAGPTSGTRIGAGLQAAVQAAQGGAVPKMILLASDGDDPARDDEWREGAVLARKHKIPVVAVGMGLLDPKAPDNLIPWRGDVVRHEDGKPVQTKLEEKPLREIARLTEGEYTRARTANRDLDLGAYFKDWIEQRSMRSESALTSPTFVQRYVWFYGAALLFFTTAMLIGNPRSSRVRAPAELPAPARPTRGLRERAYVTPETGSDADLLEPAIH